MASLRTEPMLTNTARKEQQLTYISRSTQAIADGSIFRNVCGFKHSQYLTTGSRNEVGGQQSCPEFPSDEQEAQKIQRNILRISEPPC